MILASLGVIGKGEKKKLKKEELYASLMTKAYRLYENFCMDHPNFIVQMRFNLNFENKNV